MRTFYSSLNDSPATQREQEEERALQEREQARDLSAVAAAASRMDAAARRFEASDDAPPAPAVSYRGVVGSDALRCRPLLDLSRACEQLTTDSRAQASPALADPPSAAARRRAAEVRELRKEAAAVGYALAPLSRVGALKNPALLTRYLPYVLPCVPCVPS